MSFKVPISDQTKQVLDNVILTGWTFLLCLLWGIIDTGHISAYMQTGSICAFTDRIKAVWCNNTITGWGYFDKRVHYFSTMGGEHCSIRRWWKLAGKFNDHIISRLLEAVSNTGGNPRNQKKRIDHFSPHVSPWWPSETRFNKILKCLPQPVVFSN